MSQHFSPKTVSNSLIYCSDPGNSKSFRGIGGTNLLQAINMSYGLGSYTATGLTAYGSIDTVNIPALGKMTVKSTYFNNNYPTSGQCCPAIFSFYNSAIQVSPSTTYTYAIIYKTTTGYSHPNYMYRYEYTNSSVYVTEAGVHSTNNRISLGDGWWYAWGQFTTQSTTFLLNTWFFHYEYSTNNTISIAAASLTQGTYIHDPRYLIPLNTTRQDTVAGGGGMIDVSGRGCSGTFFNGPTFSSSNGGVIVLDGTNDYLEVSNVPDLAITNKFTASIWVKSGTSTWNTYGWPMSKRDQFVMHPEQSSTAITFYVHCNPTGWTGYAITPADITQWNHYVMTFNAGSLKVYLNGRLATSATTTAQLSSDTGVMTIGRDDGLARYGNGSVSCAMLYNRDLTDVEVMQNYNAQKSRFGA